MSEPKFLLLETSDRCGEVGLGQGATLVTERSLSQSRRHARDLVPLVQEMLQEQGWQARDLDGVIVSQGPGSYTGLRVGIMSAKALAYALSCPIIGIETFCAIAHQVPESIPVVDVLCDAQQQKVYVQSFRLSHGQRKAINKLSIRPLTEWLARRDASAVVSGPGIRAYEKRFPPDIKLVDEPLRLPHVQSLLELGLMRYQAGSFSDVWTLEPIYLRPSAAEEQWERRASESES